MTVVLKRSYSLISGQTSDEIEINLFGNLFLKKSLAIVSCLELTYECKNPIAILSKFNKSI